MEGYEGKEDEKGLTQQVFYFADEGSFSRLSFIATIVLHFKLFKTEIDKNKNTSERLRFFFIFAICHVG